MKALAHICFCAMLVIALIQPANAEPLVLPLTGQRLRPIEAQTLFHTLFSDFFSEPDNTTYVQTGDISAMWLRDSAAQTLPYVRFAPAYPILAVRFAGVVEHDAKNIVTDPYANAFGADYSVWERKWEVDSLAWPILLAWVYRQDTHNRLIFTPEFHRALWSVVNTYRCEQLHATCSRYRFPGVQPAPSNPNTGMIWGAFRPSDDRVQYAFNIPQEMLAAIALQDAARLAIEGYEDRNLANEAQSIAQQVYEGIQRYGLVAAPRGPGFVYAYETDGFGHYVLADDANVPDLTSLPYLGWCAAADPTYLRTRDLTLSSNNPWYFSGTYAQGLGSPHTPAGFVWPLGIITRALTATSSAEVAQAVTTLAETDGNDGLMHESFWPNGYWLFTRASFGWANALYAELLFRSLAGFHATPLTATDSAMLPFEAISATPALTRPYTQIMNTTMIYLALSELLERANGHTVIADIANQMNASADPNGPYFHEVQDRR